MSATLPAVSSPESGSGGRSLIALSQYTPKHLTDVTDI